MTDEGRIRTIATGSVPLVSSLHGQAVDHRAGDVGAVGTGATAHRWTAAIVFVERVVAVVWVPGDVPDVG